MAPSEWWDGKEIHRGTPMVVKMENPNWSIAEIDVPPEVGFLSPVNRNKGKMRGKSAKKLTWVLLLRVHRAAGRLSSIASSTFGLVAVIRRRVKAGKTDFEELASDNGTNNDISIEHAGSVDSRRVRALFYSIIKAFLIVSLVLLCVEVVAYFKGWHFGTHKLQFQYVIATPFEIKGIFYWIYSKWVLIRAVYLAPTLQFLANLCILLFLVQCLDRLILCMGCFWIRLKKIKPVPKMNIDLESGDGEGYFPMVLVQIPMYNEREVYQQSIAAVCNLDWPKSKLLIQILDDSDQPTTQLLIKEEVLMWQAKGANIVYCHRVIRDGYKAGNLKSSMSCSYVKDYEFVAIFDADFQPTPDFLKRTVIHFKDNDEVGLVQARWSFVNKDENLLTRLQNINLSFHFEVEQQVNGIFINFFGFNGTAGVWRIKALDESGGWLERTTVEDMDIAVRAHLEGWKFVFLNDVECQCELPESYEAYRKQQHRWHSGPMQLFRLCLPDITRSKVEIPAWVVCYIPAAMSMLNIMPVPKSSPYVVPYLLFENTMSITKFSAMISGLFQLGSAYEWVITKKSGRSSEGNLISLLKKDPKHQRFSSEPNLGEMKQELLKQAKKASRNEKKHNRIYMKELSLAFVLSTASARSLLFAQGMHFYFLLFQGISFLLVGLNLIGEQVH